MPWRASTPFGQACSEVAFNWLPSEPVHGEDARLRQGDDVWLHDVLGQAPCARWDSLTGEVMSHSAFQPFRWPPMTEQSPTWVDVKVKLEGHLLVHMEFRGYRSDHDLSLQLWHVADAIQSILSETLFVPSFIVTVFQGWRVVAVSWEVGGRIYACSDGGIVVALDFPLCHFEVRFVATSSPDAFGADADRLEMRFSQRRGQTRRGGKHCSGTAGSQVQPSSGTPNGVVSTAPGWSVLISNFSLLSWQLFMPIGLPQWRRQPRPRQARGSLRSQWNRTLPMCIWCARARCCARRGRSSKQRHWLCNAMILWMRSPPP